MFLVCADLLRINLYFYSFQVRYSSLEQLLGHRFGDDSWNVQRLMILARKKARASRETTPGGTDDDEMEEDLLDDVRLFSVLQMICFFGLSLASSTP